LHMVYLYAMFFSFQVWGEYCGVVIESFESVFDHFICGIVADAVPIADVVRLKFFFDKNPFIF